MPVTLCGYALGKDGARKLWRVVMKMMEKGTGQFPFF